MRHRPKTPRTGLAFWWRKPRRVPLLFRRYALIRQRWHCAHLRWREKRFQRWRWGERAP